MKKVLLCISMFVFAAGIFGCKSSNNEAQRLAETERNVMAREQDEFFRRIHADDYANFPEVREFVMNNDIVQNSPYGNSVIVWEEYEKQGNVTHNLLINPVLMIAVRLHDKEFVRHILDRGVDISSDPVSWQETIRCADPNAPGNPWGNEEIYEMLLEYDRNFSARR